MGMPHAITERRDAERLPFLSTWAQPGASLTSQRGLANGMHSQAVAPGAAQELRQQQQQQALQQAPPGAAQELRQQQQQKLPLQLQQQALPGAAQELRQQQQQQEASPGVAQRPQ